LRGDGYVSGFRVYGLGLEFTAPIIIGVPTTFWYT
jgi:hypothetical protein